jgi:hypothetical protein
VFEAILIGAASYRLWRLIAVDAITEPLRDRWLPHLSEWWDSLVTCPWCLGSWIAFGVTWATDAVVGLPVPFLVGLAAAVVVGVLGQLLD